MKVDYLAGDDGDINSIFNLFEGLDKIEVEAGFLSPNVIHPGTGTPLTDIAYLQQYGSEHHMIPSRPFISDGAVLSEQGIAKSIPEVMRNYLKNGMGLSAFTPIEKVSRESIARAIAEQKFVPLSKNTIKIREGKGNHSTTILVDEGYLINGIEAKTTRNLKKS